MFTDTRSQVNLLTASFINQLSPLERDVFEVLYVEGRRSVPRVVSSQHHITPLAAKRIADGVAERFANYLRGCGIRVPAIYRSLRCAANLRNQGYES